MLVLRRLSVPILAAVLTAVPSTVRAVPVAYVAHGNGGPLGGQLSVLDNGRLLQRNFRRFESSGAVPAGVQPWWMVMHPDGSRLYVVDRREDTGYLGELLVLDTATDATIATVPLGWFAGHVAIHPAGTFVYVTNYGDDTVSVVDTSTNAATTIPVPDGPSGIAVDATGARLYVGSSGDPFANTPGALTVLDTTTLATVDSAPLPTNAGDVVAIHPDGTRAYLLGAGLRVVDTATLGVLTTLSIRDANTLAVHPSGLQVYVTNFCGPDDPTCFAPGGVTIVDTATNTVKHEIPVGVRPQGLAVSPDGRWLYVTHGLSDSVAVLRAKCRASRVTHVPVGDTSVWVTFRPCPTCEVRGRPCR